MIEGKNYCIRSDNIIAHEIIGLNARVAESSDANKKGLEGTVVDETKGLLVLEVGGKEKKIPKKEAVFEFSLGNEFVEVDGRAILEKPENRIKFFLKKWRKANAGKMQ